MVEVIKGNEIPIYNRYNKYIYNILSGRNGIPDIIIDNTYSYLFPEKSIWGTIISDHPLDLRFSMEVKDINVQYTMPSVKERHKLMEYK